MPSYRITRRRTCTAFPRRAQCDYTSVLELDLASVKPERGRTEAPQDRIELPSLKSKFTELFTKPVTENGFGETAGELTRSAIRAAGHGRYERREPRRFPAAVISRRRNLTPGSAKNVVEMVDNRPTPDRDRSIASRASRAGIDLGHGDVLIAAITSCTNTSNPACCSRPACSQRRQWKEGSRSSHTSRPRWRRVARGDRVSAKRRPAAVPGKTRLQPRRLRLHDLHRQFRAARPAARRGGRPQTI